MTKPNRPLRAGLDLELDDTGTALYVRVSPEHESGEVARTVDLGDDVLVDYDAEGAIVGFEVVGLDRPRVARVLGALRERFAAAVPALERLTLFGA